MATIGSVILCAQIAAAGPLPKAPKGLTIDGKPPLSRLFKLTFQDDFERGIPLADSDDTHTLFKKVSNGTGLVELSAAPARENIHSLHVRLAKAGTSNFRQELRVKSVTDELPIDGSQDYWYGEANYIPSSSSLLSESVITQWHTHDPKSGHSPVLGTRIKNGRWLITRESTDFESQDVGPVDTDQWVTWVYHVRWRRDGSGLIQIWKNGRLIVDRSGLQTAYEGEVNQPYLLVGRYTSSWKQPSNSDSDGTMQESFHDALKICTGPECDLSAVEPPP
jgi:hypothetical protein